MPERKRPRYLSSLIARLGKRLGTLARELRGRLGSLWSGLDDSGDGRGDVRIEVLVSDRRLRRSLESEIRSTIPRLERVLGGTPPSRGHVAIVVQQVIRTNRQLAGCYLLGERADGTRYALIRLALRVNGRELDQDEVLSTLAEEWIGLWVQESQAPSVLVPLDLDPPEAPPVATPGSALSRNPLAARSNGSGPPPREAP